MRTSQRLRLTVSLHLHTEHIAQFLEMTTFKLLEDLINKGLQVFLFTEDEKIFNLLWVDDP